MAAFQITGGEPLIGSIDIQGSKNASLPILAASLLHQGITVLYGCPNILDVRYMIEIIRSLGCKIEWNSEFLQIDASEVDVEHLSRSCLGKMRSSILLLGALIGRCGKLKLDYPGGCTIGARPIDMHLNAFKSMGVQIKEVDDQIICYTDKLYGKRIVLPYPSVGATENLMMAAVWAEGVTWIENAAKEPEVIELARFLNQMGGCIHGEGTDRIGILGKCSLHDVAYKITGDRIVAGTYLLAAAGTKGRIEIRGVQVKDLQAVLHICEEMGCRIQKSEKSVFLESKHRLFSVKDIHTQPFPGFPTDMQSQLMAVLSTAKGVTIIHEHVFEKRFRTAKELGRMGADIQIKNNRAVIRGVESLKGYSVSAMDLRGGAALIIAGLMAEGDSIVENSIFVERGYQDICKDLRQLGANIKIINGK